MRRNRLFQVAALCFMFSAATAMAQTDKDESTKDPNRERLGLRAGYVGTTSKLNNVFGGGLDLTIHWLQRIKYPFGVDLGVGAFYLGSTSRDDITISVFNRNFDNVSMRVIHITLAPTVEFAAGERTHLYATAGPGVYTVSLLLDEAFSEADLTNSHFGVLAGGGIIRQVSGNWFFDASFQLHKIWTSQSVDDLFYHYSEGDSDPVFYDVTVGIMLRLF